jgi:hypothetical protein
MRSRQFALPGVLLLVLRTMTESIHAMPQPGSAAGAAGTLPFSCCACQKVDLPANPSFFGAMS